MFSLWPQAGLSEALTARVSGCGAASGEILPLPPPRTTHDTPERLWSGTSSVPLVMGGRLHGAVLLSRGLMGREASWKC